MSRIITGIVIGSVLTFGTMNYFESSTDIYIEPITHEYNIQSEIEKYQRPTKLYQAKIKGKGFSEFIQDSKGAPCYCQHRQIPNTYRLCEHEEPSCNRGAAKQCESQLKHAYKCQTGIAATINIHDLNLLLKNKREFKSPEKPKKPK